MSSAPRDIDEYVRRFPKDVQRLLQDMRATVRRAAPRAQEVISYGIPAFAVDGKRLVWFAAHKRHVGFYPGVGAIVAFKKDLSTYKSAKGSVQFPFDEALPLALVSQIVKFRLKQNARKAKVRGR